MLHRTARNVTLAIALLAAGAHVAAAQSNTSQHAAAQMFATIEPATLIYSSGSINFGNVPFIPGIYSLNPLNPGPGQDVAQFTVPSLNASYNIDFPCSAQIWGIGGVEMGELTFLPDIYVTTNDEPQINGIEYQAAGYTCGGTPLLWWGDVSQLVFWVGGRIQVNPSQPAGQYEGAYVVSIYLIGM